MRAAHATSVTVILACALVACGRTKEASAERDAKATCRRWYETSAPRGFDELPPTELITDMRDAADRAAKRDAKWKSLAEATAEYTRIFLEFDVHRRRLGPDVEERMQRATDTIQGVCFGNFGVKEDIPIPTWTIPAPKATP